jgi:zinc/manganese transport system permease protein
MLLLYSAIGVFHFIFRKKFFALSFDGKGGWLWEFLFFLSFALVLVSSVSIAGVLQVFSFLVIPALIGRLFTKKPLKTLLIGWAAGLLASALGLIASYNLDLPTAPLFIAFLSVGFFIVLASKALRAG